MKVSSSKIIPLTKYSFLPDHNEKSKPEGTYHKQAYQRFCKAIQPGHLDELIPEIDSTHFLKSNSKPSSMRERVKLRNQKRLDTIIAQAKTKTTVSTNAATIVSDALQQEFTSIGSATKTQKPSF